MPSAFGQQACCSWPCQPPKNQLAKWRIKLAPEAPMELAGEIACFVLDWVGNKVFYHECLRRGMQADMPLGPLRPALMPQLPPGQSHNAVKGRTLAMDLDELASKPGAFQLDMQQLSVARK